MRNNSLIVIGGNGAGLSAASQARRIDPEMEILVLEQSPYLSFSACGFPFYLRGLIPEFKNLFILSPQKLEEKRRIKVLTQTRVKEIRPKEGLIIVESAPGREFSLSYQKLLIATGALPVLPPGFSLSENEFALRSAGDAEKLDRYLKIRSPREALIIGGSALGLEIAESFFHRDIKVTLLEAAPHLLPSFSALSGELAARQLQERGIRVLTKEKIVRIQNRGRRIIAHTASGNALEADFALWAAGVKPEVGLAEQAGIALGKSGGILTSREMRTSDPHIFAAGDCAEYFNPVNRKGVFFPLGSAANRSGRAAGNAIAGATDEFPGVLQSLAFKIFDLEIARTGLSATQAGQDFPGFQIHQTGVQNKPRYLPDSSELQISLLFDPRDEKLLGAEIAGKAGAAQRINVFAAALSAGFTLSQIQKLDLIYYPDFAPVWDPILYAAGEALTKK